MLEEHFTVLYNVIYAQVYICCVSLPGCCQKTYKHRKETVIGYSNILFIKHSRPF